jgi:hypothetical protein
MWQPAIIPRSSNRLLTPVQQPDHGDRPERPGADHPVGRVIRNMSGKTIMPT